MFSFIFYNGQYGAVKKLIALLDPPISTGDNSFQYTPLDQSKPSIRVLEILPQTSRLSRSIHCRIIDTTIDDQYTCVSYVWGSPNESKKTILVQGRPLKIQPNLWEFFKVARRKYPGKRFWVDAVCINQSDSSEKNHQVKQMGKIFSKAEEVIGWVGNNKRLAALFNDLNNQFTYRADSEQLKRSTILENSYWTRAWITQEILLASELRFLAADRELSHEDMTECLHPRFIPSTLLGHIKPLLIDDRSTVIGTSLFRLLALFKDKQCGIKRDRVFSLLALCNEKLDPIIDYEVPDCELAIQILQHCSGTACLCSITLLSHVFEFDVPKIPSGLTIRDWSVAVEASENDTLLIELHFQHITMLSTKCCSPICQVNRLPRSYYGDPLPPFALCLRDICPKARGHLFLDENLAVLHHTFDVGHKYGGGFEGQVLPRFSADIDLSRGESPVIVWLDFKTARNLLRWEERYSSNYRGEGYSLCEVAHGYDFVTPYQTYNARHVPRVRRLFVSERNIPVPPRFSDPMNLLWPPLFIEK